MSGKITARLAELGVVLPAAPAPAANYLPFTRTGNLLHIAGQIPKQGDKFTHMGKVGDAVSVEEAQAAAKVCIINFLAQVQAAAGSLERVKTIAKINVFVNSSTDFTAQPQVANGASDFIVEVFGEQGRHARSAVGVAQLPFGVPVEIDGVVELHNESHM